MRPLGGWTIQNTIISSFIIIQFVLYVDEFWLDCRRMYALIVKELFDFFGDSHVILKVVTSDMGRGNYPIAS